MASRTVELIFQNTVRNGGEVKALSSEVSKLLGIHKLLDEEQKKVGDSAKSLLSSFAAMAPAAGGVLGIFSAIVTVGAAAGGAMLGLAKSTATLAEQQQNMAERTGLTIREVGLFSQLAENSGVSVGSLTGSMRGLSKALSENNDEGKAAKSTLRDLGITLTDQFGAAIPTRDIFVKLADGIGKIEDPAKRADAAIKILGRGGIELLPLLRSNVTDSLRELEKLGVGFSDDGAKKALEFDSALDILSARLSVFKRELGETAAAAALFLFPELRPKGKPVSIPQLSQGNVPTADLSLTTDELLANTRKKNASPSLTDSQRDALSLQGRRSIIENILGSGDRETALTRKLASAQKELADATRESDVERVRSSVSVIESLKKQIELLKLAKSEGTLKVNPETFGRSAEDLQALFGGGPRIGAPNRQPSLFRRGETGAITNILPSGEVVRIPRDAFVSPESSRVTISPGLDSAGFSESIRNQQTIDERGRAERLSSIQRELGFTERILSLRSNERLVSNDLYNARTAAALREYQITGDLVQLRRASDEAAKQRALEILEVKQREKDQARENAGRAFDAVIAGGAGIRGFVTSQALGIGRTISQNLGGEVGNFRLSVPGQGTADNPSLLGRLLKGTPLGLDPAKALGDATIQNTAATSLNTAELAKFSALVGGLNGGTNLGGAAAASGLLSSIPGASSASGILSLFTGRGGVSGPTASQLSQSRDEFGALVQGVLNPSASGGSATLDAIQNQQRASKALTLNGISSSTSGRGQSTALGAIGTAGVVAAGTFGVVNGVRQGGAQGTLTAASSALGTAAALDPEPISKAILAAAALATGLAGSLIGDPKKRRDKGITELLERSVFDGAVSQSFDVDTFGRAIDSNSRGETRIIRQEITINALDARSIMDRHEDISAAAAAGLEKPGPLRESVRGFMEQ